MAKLKINIDGVLRDMTDEEMAQYELDQIELTKIKEADEVKIAAKEALLQRLGITAEEAATLLA